MDEQNTPEVQEEQVPQFRGLYKHVNISVKALDCIILASIAVIIIFTIVGLQNPGFAVTFDSQGGTDVPFVDGIPYEELVPEPEPPTREGYEFTGWYIDPGCATKWDMETDPVYQDLTLYAGWEKK